MRAWTASITSLLAVSVAVAAAGWHAAASAAQGADREAAYRANNIGVAQLEQYDYDAAAASFRKALDGAPGLSIARINLAIALFYSNNADAALKEAQAAASAVPSSPQPFYMLGLIARAQDRADAAVAAFQKVLAIDPGDVATKVNLGQVYTQQRNYGGAIPILREALAAEPYNVTAAYSLAIALTRSGAADEGRAAMQKFEALRGAPYARTYSQTYLDQGPYAEAIASTGAEPELVDAAPPAVTFTDATSALMPGKGKAGAQKGEGAGSVVLTDIDNDGALDLLEAGPDGVHLYRNSRGALTDITAASGLSDVGPATAAVAGDYDNDGRVDLFVLRPNGNRLLHQAAGGRFELAANPLPAYPHASRSAAFVDFDHDGDLDIFIAGDVRLKPDATPDAVRPKPDATRAAVVSGFSRTDAAASNQLLRNNGDGTFTDVTAEAHVGDGEAQGIAVVPTDFDNKRDVDLLVVTRDGAPRLFQNLRDGSFRDAARESGLPQGGHYGAVAAADVNKDGYPDFFFARADGPGIFALSDGHGRFTKADGPAESAGSVAAQFLDYDNDGLLDLFVFGPSRARVFRNLGTRWQEVSQRAGVEAAALQASSPDPFVAAAAGDLDGDGDTDVVVRLADGSLRVWRNDGGNRNHSIRARLEGRVSNRGGIGSKIDVRAGSLRQRIESSAAVPPAAPADILFGLGQRAAADVLRVLWPSGTVQAETTPAAAAPQPVVITELNRKPSSCPYLFTWNGERFAFLTDFMGGGELGYWEAPGVRAQPDPDEYVRIPPHMLQPRNGRYELRVTNELEEVLFVDRLQLVAVDHPGGTAVYPNEGLLPQPPPPFALTTTGDARPPVSAVDDRGRNVLGSLVAVDRDYVDGFTLIQPRGYAEPHALTLDLGSGADRVVLLLTGWTDYAFSSDNVAAHQKGLTLQPPSLQVKDASGAWRTLIDDIGIPVGRPQTIAVDLRGRLHGARTVRIVTNMRIYWDRILVDRSGGGAETRISRLDAASADLHRRGFSAEVTPDGREPFVYDYTRVRATSPWKIFPGRYTREGDVRPLLRTTDDMFVIAMPGDELALAYDASALPPLPVGWTRTFLLYADGFSKEMDINSASPHEVGPLPFHGMRQYPYSATETPPRTAAYLDYLARYNTRVVRSELPALELAGR